MALAWKAGWVNSPRGFESPYLRHTRWPRTCWCGAFVVRRSAQLGLEAVAPLLGDQQAPLIEPSLDRVDEHRGRLLGVDPVPRQLGAVLEDVVDDAGHQVLVDGRREEVAAGEERLGAVGPEAQRHARHLEDVGLLDDAAGVGDDDRT